MQWVRCFKDNYEINPKGQVRRAAPGRGARVGKLLNPYPGKGGYQYVKLYCDGEAIQMRVDLLTKLVFGTRERRKRTRRGPAAIKITDKTQRHSVRAAS